MSDFLPFWPVFADFFDAVATLLQVPNSMLQTKLGAITSRRRKDGATADWAHLRGMRDGEQVYQEAKAFDRKPAAQAGGKRRDSTMSETGIPVRAGVFQGQ